MIFRTLTADGDWTFGKGINSYSQKLDAIVLNVKTRLKSWKNNCFFAPAEGIDYSNYLGYGTKVFLDSNIKRVILKSEGVISLSSFDSVLATDERKVTIKAGINTIYGPGIVEV